MENDLAQIIRELYTDVFDSGNCRRVDSHYAPDAVCHFNGRDLTVESLKSSMRDFIAAHSKVVTAIESIIVSGNRTYARLVREVTPTGSSDVRKINIMVEKRFEGSKIKELWFMVDDPVYRDTWARPGADGVS